MAEFVRSDAKGGKAIDDSKGTKTKEFVVEGYIVDAGRILLVHHKKLGIWIPPGGHIEDNETPENALVREIKEEVGLDVQVCLSKTYPEDFPIEVLPQPHHIQLENIGTHQHIDLVYVCRIVGGRLERNDESHAARWFDSAELDAGEGVPKEVVYFAKLILSNAEARRG